MITVLKLCLAFYEDMLKIIEANYTGHLYIIFNVGFNFSIFASMARFLKITTLIISITIFFHFFRIYNVLSFSKLKNKFNTRTFLNRSYVTFQKL